MENIVKVVIPIYKTELSTLEIRSLQQAYMVLKPYPLIVVKPESLDTSSLEASFPALSYKSFDDDYFKGISGYNRLMLSSDFYAVFFDTEYILIYQLDAYIFPSLAEGFGIPVLEAWSCMTPVILSNNHCFNEVAAEAGYYFTPDSQESIRDAIEKVLSDKTLQNELIKKGRSRLSLFSWEKTVTQTSILYKPLS
jgi:glycosyltransferase involved in cell wall biosynthesis